MLIHTDYPLKSCNTFHLDVKAKYLAEINCDEDLRLLYSRDEFLDNKRLFLGEGSNILFTHDFDGLIMKNNIKGIEVVEETEDSVIVEAGGGELWDELVNFCVEKNYYGAENLSGIPGTVGAAPIQNIGAYGVELKDVFYSLEGYFLDGMKKGFFELNDCDFSYRHSVFKDRFRHNFFVTKVKVKLSKVHSLKLNYRDLKEYFHDKKLIEITLQDVRKAIKEIRQSKLPDPVEFGNAGSFFKNPEITNKASKELKAKFPDLVYFKVDEKKVKIPAAWLIEKCGLKGYRLGDVATYSKQPLVIINMGNATGAEIISFAEHIQNKVKKKFQIDLIPEVNIL